MITLALSYILSGTSGPAIIVGTPIVVGTPDLCTGLISWICQQLYSIAAAVLPVSWIGIFRHVYAEHQKYFDGSNASSLSTSYGGEAANNSIATEDSNSLGTGDTTWLGPSAPGIDLLYSTVLVAALVATRGYCSLIDLAQRYCQPIFEVYGLQFIWRYPGVGPARKTLSTILFTLLCALLYTPLASILAGLGWTCFAILLILAVVMLPVTALFWIHYFVMYSGEKVLESAKQTARNRPTAIEEDITFFELGIAIVVAMISLPTVGSVVLILTTLKSPFVIISLLLGGLVSMAPFLSLVKELKKNPFVAILWSIFLIPTWFVGFIFAIPTVGFGVLFSILVKVLAGALWPAYVACGWLRSFGKRRRQPDSSGVSHLKTIIQESAKAGYQVIWLSDTLSNVMIVSFWSPILTPKLVMIELMDLFEGRRSDISANIRKVSWFPSVRIGLFMDGSWIFDVAMVAKRLNVPTDFLKTIWESFFTQLVKVGKELLASELLTVDYLDEVPPALTIGLPMLVAFKAIQRSVESDPDSDFILLEGSDIKISPLNRPRSLGFFDDAWDQLMKARLGWAKFVRNETKSLDDSNSEILLLESLILAGGAPTSELPTRLSSRLSSGSSPNGTNSDVRASSVGGRSSNGGRRSNDGSSEVGGDAIMNPSLKEVYQSLTALGIAVGKQTEFKKRLGDEVYRKLTKD